MQLPPKCTRLVELAVIAQALHQIPVLVVVGWIDSVSTGTKGLV